MDSERNQPLINNPYPTLENNNTNFNQPNNNYLPQNQGWNNEKENANGQFNQNQGWNQNQQPNQGWNQQGNNQNQNNQGWNNNSNNNQGWNNNQNQPNQGWNNNQPNQAPIVNPYKNQGYQPNGMLPGFNNNNFPPNYTGPHPYAPGQNYPPGQQPYMPAQQGMPNLKPDKIIIIQQHSSMPCRMCGFDGMGTWRQVAGCATYGWCICLMLTAVCCWIPFCIDSCYDTQIICTRCGQIKAEIPARCC